MLSDVVDGISVRLNQLFGDTHEINTENVTQGLQPHSFFIRPLPVTHKPLIGHRAQRTYSFVLTYFPDTENMARNEEMMGVAETLLDGLEYITLLSGERIRGKDLEAEIVDGVLHVSVKYTLFIDKASEDKIELMEELSTEIGVKGERDGS